MKYYFTYKTTNKINGNVYYGKHETYDVDDGYLGSGIRLSRSIKKHGKENFRREILSFYDSKEKMNRAEEALVTEDVIKSGNTYNIALGGQGGNLGEIVNNKLSKIGKGRKCGPQSDKHKKAISLSKKGYTPTEETIEKTRKTVILNWSKLSEKERKEKFGHPGEKNGFYGKKHSTEFIEKQRQDALSRGSVNHPSAKPVTINGVTYPLMKTAIKDLGITRSKLIKLIGEDLC